MCERFLGSLRRECLDHFVILNERQVRRLVKEYRAYFNHARPHQGIEQRVPCGTERSDVLPVTATLSSRPVLNGLHHDYCWLAASSAEQSQTQCSTYQ
ncbi:MAG: integrase core domain-containing protein [Chloroflexota bacterium]|nr:integrase core domain-containing protein [Chloroflexota bacterium]